MPFQLSTDDIGLVIDVNEPQPVVKRNIALDLLAYWNV